jgi:hypothetical protein
MHDPTVSPPFADVHAAAEDIPHSRDVATVHFGGRQAVVKCDPVGIPGLLCCWRTTSVAIRNY